VVLGNEGETVIWSADSGTLKIAWAQLDALTFIEDEIVLKILIKTKGLSGLVNPILFSADPLSEIADGQAVVWNDVVLAMPELIYGITATYNSSENGEFRVKNFPDPFQYSTTFEFILPEVGSVHLVVMRGNGQEVYQNTISQQSPGKYSISFDASTLQPGVYLYRATFLNGKERRVTSGKMIISR
jgi:hypothetical protein